MISGVAAVLDHDFFRRRPWAQATAVCLARISAVASFFFVPYYPVWAILLIALDVRIVSALTRPGAFET